VKTDLRCRFGSERLVEFQHGKFSRVEDLVAKLAIAFHTQYFEIDVTPWNLLFSHYTGRGTQGEVPPPL
jgi:hypothetical protein